MPWQIDGVPDTLRFLTSRDDGRDDLAPPLVGQPDDDTVLHQPGCGDGIGHLAGGNLESTGNDEVVGPTIDGESVVSPVGDVAGELPIIGRSLIEIPRHHHRTRQ